ncbi:MAG: ABC transporter permease [Lachnospiraceae bacterium]|nr:ABC transporter permease [Lachnospiraceae bacterium]
MKQISFYFSFIGMELKKLFHALPKFLIGAIVLTLFISTVAFCGIKLLYPSDVPTTVQIDLVTADTSDASRLAVNFISQMQSTKSMFTFQFADEEKAYQDLHTGKAAAVMLLPTNMVESIIDGTNKPVQVIFADTSALSTLLLQELTSAGGQLLSSAQAGIYTITDLYIANNLTEYLQASYDSINRTNLSYALARDQIFQRKSTSATGKLSVTAYYVCSAALLFLLLFGAACSFHLSAEPLSFCQKLKSMQIPNALVILVQWFVTFLSYLFITVLVLFLFYMVDGFLLPNDLGFPAFSISRIFVLLFLLIFISIFVVCIYRLTPNASTGILLLFVLSLLLLFLSGCFIPAAFFPDSLRTLSACLPTTYMQQLLGIWITDAPCTFVPFVPAAFYMAFFFIFAWFGYSRRFHFQKGGRK